MTIDTTHETELDVLPPARPMQSEAIGKLMEHAQAMAAAKQLGDALAATDMVPAVYRAKPANAAAAILYGAELGLNPIQSLQQIFVVHGQPAIYARTAVALAKRHGVMVETVTSTDDQVTVRASDTRTGQVEESTWTPQRAEKAGFTSNKKYATEPQAMLWAKAAMEVCRRIAPDVLLGIPYSREELELEPRPARVRSERVGRGVDALRQLAGEPDRSSGADVGEGVESSRPAAAAAADIPRGDQAAESGMSAATRKKWLNRMFALLGEADCTDRDDQLIVIAKVSGHPDLQHRDQLDDEQLRETVNQLNAWAKAGALGQQITELLNAATIAEVSAPEEGDDR